MSSRKNNIDKYQCWDRCWFKSVEIRDTLNYLIDDTVSNGVTVTFRGKELHFNCLNKEDLDVEFQFDKLNYGISGSYNQRTNTIELDVSIKNNAAKLYETINHEFKHKVQHALTARIEQYKDNPEYYQYLNVLKHEIENGQNKLGAFGFNFIGDTHVSSDMCVTMSDMIDERQVSKIEYDIAEAFYHMQLSERESFDYGIDVTSPLSPQAKIRNDKDKERYRVALSEYFHLGDVSYEYLCSLVDVAKENIIFSQTPRNDMEAAFTYKIAAILNAQNDPTIEKGRPEVEQYLKDCAPEITAERLQDSYNVPFVDIRYQDMSELIMNVDMLLVGEGSIVYSNEVEMSQNVEEITGNDDYERE